MLPPIKLKRRKNKVTLYEWITISWIACVLSFVVLSYVYLNGLGIYQIKNLETYKIAISLNGMIVLILGMIMELPTLHINRKKG